MENMQKQPAFDTPETIHTPDKPMVYQNFANNYGKPQEKLPKKDPKEQLQIRLLIAGCIFCACLAGALGIALAVLP